MGGSHAECRAAPALARRPPGTLTGVLDRLDRLESEYETALIQLSDPAVIADQRQLRDVSRRYKELAPVVAAFREYRAVASDLATAREMLADITLATAGTDSEDREMVRHEIDTAPLVGSRSASGQVAPPGPEGYGQGGYGPPAAPGQRDRGFHRSGRSRSFNDQVEPA